MYKIRKALVLIIFGLSNLCAQSPKIHSHNDYAQNVPFWNAFSAGVNSIEVDVFLKNDRLYVTHSESDIRNDRTIEQLYLQPLQKTIALGLGNGQDIQILIDIKSDPYKTLDALVASLKKYPELTQNKKVAFCISGNKPKVSDFTEYPDFINFDYQSLENISAESWEKVSLISLDFGKFSTWNGKGRLTKLDKEKIVKIITKAHSYNKPFRFWGTPDSETAWKTFTELGIDFINTDHPFTCVQYVKTLSGRVFKNTLFSEVYHPTFEHDQKSEPVKNVILLIGDGNGLSEISAATLANNNMSTLTQLKNIGLIKTQSSDDFTTDSAAAGTALATGEKTYNRAIGVDSLGNPLKNITEILQDQNFNTGIITTDAITGATPSTFYAHQKDRGNTIGITKDLLDSKLTLFAGGGKNQFKSFGNFKIIDSVDGIGRATGNRIGFFMSDDGVPSVLDGRGRLLDKTTENSLNYFKAKGQPFFLMIEGAQIDSYAHNNNVAGIVTEGIDFDRAITKAVRFADNNPGTLVIITADHETSGFSIPQGNVNKNQIEGDFTTHDHTGTLVPIFAYGPHSNEFSDVYENKEVFHKILGLLKTTKKNKP